MQNASSGNGSGLNRRKLLQLSGVSATALALGINFSGARAAETPGQEFVAEPDLKDVFGLGVAAGAPRPDGVVLWTRLTPQPLAEDGLGGMPQRPITVNWQVARDEGFVGIEKEGDALAQPELSHAVHPRVEGLQAGTEYFYRFRVGTEISRVGRFKTLPAANTGLSKFSFGFVSCQAWYHGHFTAHKHLAQEQDLDLVLFLGDYIYEYGITEKNLTRQGAEVGPAHRVETKTLAQYRLRYSLFKTDPHLQDVHARAACAVIWDDHEVQNNYTGKFPAESTPDPNFRERIAAAYRAFYENMPLDVEALPQGDSSDITTKIDVGNLIRFSLLDSRQFRDPAPKDEADRTRPDRTILGPDQEAWVANSLQTSPATWNILANGVVLTPITDDRTDQWDGYPAARERMLEVMNRASNPVMLSGDIHKHSAAELKQDFNDQNSRTLGVELVCTSVASDGDGAKTDSNTSDWLDHPYVKQYDGRRGYVHVTVTPQDMVSSFYCVDWIEKDDTAPKQLSARFYTKAGQMSLSRM
ncbi:alkaline phosphatase D family protein [Curtobacterium sp. S6]|uniref:alkaline phosphatase D family protein n=1 Tax=Curtobacterium sp. S6 TaxID=1479623 RepID=UPI0004AA1EE6|nr:alkaline phosphatase D family protein [Curtobacterium sp. S6]